MKAMHRLAAPTCAAALLAATPAFAHHPGGPGNAGAAGPINTISASTLPKGRTVVGATLEYTSLGGLSDNELAAFAEQTHEEDRDEHAHSTRSIVSRSLGISYGVTDDLMLSLRLPYVTRNDIREAHKHHHDEPAEIEARGDSSGFGDLSTMVQWRFLSNRASGTEAAFLAGAKAPTGETHKVDADDHLFEAEFQPGSGSWDGMFGLALTQRIGAWSFDANGLYTLVEEGEQKTDLGDRVHFNVAVSYRALGGAAGAPSHNHVHGGAHAHSAAAGPAIDLVLELNGEWHDRQAIEGVVDPNSGGHTLYIAPGVRFSEGDWSGFASVGIPVVSEVNGVQSESELRVLTGASYGF